MKLLEKFAAVAGQRPLSDNTIDAYRGRIRQVQELLGHSRVEFTSTPEPLIA
jgi:site-specific recombinase XerD